MPTALALIAAYLLGSVPFAMISSRVFGLADPRTYGSGNPGATNVLRSGNKKAALLTLIGDALKGTLAVVVAQRAGLGDTQDVAAFEDVGDAAFLYGSARLELHVVQGVEHIIVQI